MTPPVIDIHSHYVPHGWPDLQEAVGGGDWPSLRVDSATQATIMLGEHEFRRISDACWNADLRLADMDADGVDIQVVSALSKAWAIPQNSARSRRKTRGFR